MRKQKELMAALSDLGCQGGRADVQFRSLPSDGSSEGGGVGKEGGKDSSCRDRPEGCEKGFRRLP